MTLPKPLRKALGVDKGGVVMATAEKDGIVLHPAVAFPIELYSDVRIAEFDEADAQLGRHMARKRA
jgi:bifunctional DNA-binding transcriptional regulator/antitoxin component of YhaV-PrlF toxin-antitoxin module